MDFVFSKYLRKLVVCFLFVFLLGTECFATEKASWLFVQTASSGSFEQIEGQEGQYTLKLFGISPCMISFTDRPDRNARMVQTAEFTGQWLTDTTEGNYNANPPNGALVLSSNSFEDVLVFCLENPSYDEKNQTLSYKVTTIKITNEHKEKYPQYKIRSEPPKEFKQSVLFIDNSWGGLGG